MVYGLTLMGTEAGRELPAPPWVFGLIGFGLLMALLFITIAIGKGRPHS
jgi:hypothetical protein